MDMWKSIVYKEWLKTRWYLLGIAVMMAVALAFRFVGFAKVVQFNGAMPVWATLVMKDSTFMESLRYLPLLAGVALAVAQWVPEMNRKCLKLTLHLPYPRGRMLFLMYAFGVVCLLAISGVISLALGVFLSGYLPSELSGRILMTMLPWHLAALAGYFWVSGLVTEPSWTGRVLVLLLLAGLVRFLFISPVPEAYNCILLAVVLFVLCGQLILFHSIARFREGLQD